MWMSRVPVLSWTDFVRKFDGEEDPRVRVGVPRKVVVSVFGPSVEAEILRKAET